MVVSFLFNFMLLSYVHSSDFNHGMRVMKNSPSLLMSAIRRLVYLLRKHVGRTLLHTIPKSLCSLIPFLSWLKCARVCCVLALLPFLYHTYPPFVFSFPLADYSCQGFFLCRNVPIWLVSCFGMRGRIGKNIMQVVRTGFITFVSPYSQIAGWDG